MRRALLCLAFIQTATVASADDKKLPKTLLPKTLDRAAISKGIATISKDVKNCQSVQYDGKIVKATIKVGPYGDVVDVKTTGASAKDSRLEPCVRGWVAEAVFPATREGGSFTYPFKFYPRVRPYMPDMAGMDDLLNDEPLTKAEEDAGLATVKDKIDACYAATKLARAVRVRTEFTVTEAGKVEKVTAKATAGDHLETCVADALALATFKASKSAHFVDHAYILVPQLPPQ